MLSHVLLLAVMYQLGSRAWVLQRAAVPEGVPAVARSRVLGRPLDPDFRASRLFF